MEGGESLFDTLFDEEDAQDVEMFDVEEGELVEQVPRIGEKEGASIEQITKAEVGESFEVGGNQVNKESNRGSRRQKKRKNKRKRGTNVGPNITDINRKEVRNCRRRPPPPPATTTTTAVEARTRKRRKCRRTEFESWCHIRSKQVTLLTRNMKCFKWLCLFSLVNILSALSPIHGTMVNEKNLHVGEELFKETLPFRNGACLYQLRGLKPHTWYEVKISYPASIPASFSLQLSNGYPELGLNQGRKLLNTEKLIFKSDEILTLSEQGGTYVLVNVEPEGIVAIPGKQERDYVIYNIVCDELLMGIPHEAWYVVVLVLICLVFAFVVPSFLPSFLLPAKGKPLFDPITKDS